MKKDRVIILINRKRYELEASTVTGRALKELANIPLVDVLFLDRPGCDDLVVGNDQEVTLDNGAQLYSSPPADYGTGAPGLERTVVFINRVKYVLDSPTQTGRALKELGGIALTDVLFLEQPGDDLVIANDDTILLRDGSRLHSSPPADYGSAEIGLDVRWQDKVEIHRQPDGWTFVVFKEWPIPPAYQPQPVRLLVKLPPGFPDAQPDMFWVSPAVKLMNGSSPKGTSTESVLGGSWQRFSWHLSPGAWRPGISTLDDFLRCVRARFEQKD
ncbi:MAG: E2/UBC family protein [Deltaproteobacteria bacterium]|nr:E2/UBC family protein [Deltaproteobacteria bacterium]